MRDPHHVVVIAILSCLYCQAVLGAEYRHLGCYKDSPTNRDLDGHSSTMDPLTVELCAAECISYGYPYSGLQAGTMCFCGDTYNQRGASNNCTTCTSPDRCGGVNSSHIFYNSDTTLVGRQPVAYDTQNSYVKARNTCIKKSGDLIVPNSQAVIETIVNMWNGKGQTAVWVGLRKRHPTAGVYEWTDENEAVTYYSKEASYKDYWSTGDTQDGDCVSLVLETGKWKSLSCDTSLPFVCNQMPQTEPETSTDETETGEDNTAQESKRLALFIVLPLFLFCYGGSCILYCIHKIIKNCNRKPKPKMALNDGMEKRPMAYSDNPPRRPLSASRRVYPAPVDLNMPTKAMPVYIPQQGGKQAAEYKPDGMRPTSSSGVNLAVPNPPPYDDEKRAKLLENAANESRDRRAKEEAAGRPLSSPFAKKNDDGSPRDGPSPSGSTKSSTKLLGEDKEDTSTDMMSINEILKKKVQDKKKPKKVASS